MITEGTSTVMSDSDSDSDSDQSRAYKCTGNEPIWSSGNRNTALQNAKQRLQNMRENRFINELITSISQESIAAERETASTESPYDDQGSEYSVQTEETEIDEPKLFEKVGEVIHSWKSEVNEISKSIARKKAKESKSRTDQWLKSQAKAKAERERIQRHEDRFVKFVESSERKLDHVSNVVQQEAKSAPETLEFNIKYRPMRLIELNDLGKDILTVDTLYKTTFAHLSKKTACWITSNTEDEKLREELESALKEVHGQVDYKTDFWDPDIRLKAPTEEPYPKPNPKSEITTDANDDVPELITSLTVEEGFRPRPELDILSANAFLDYKSKITNNLESCRGRDWNGTNFNSDYEPSDIQP